MNNQAKTVFIAGCGYIGKRVAGLARKTGAEVTCMIRSDEYGQQLTLDGFKTVLCSLDDPARIPDLDVSGSVIYYFVPPPGGGFSDPRARNFCKALGNSSPPSKIIYISATSVYGVTGGAIVTESSPATPASAMGKRRLAAENTFREYGSLAGAPVIILRVSGIYGPGRLPLMQIQQQQPLLREEESGPSNRIHADDLAQVCLAAAEKGGDGDIFNISDGHPSSMTTYFNAVADLLKQPRQPMVTLEEARRVMSPLMLSYSSESRIVDNSKMLARLGITLRYPTLAEGLPASL